MNSFDVSVITVWGGEEDSHKKTASNGNNMLTALFLNLNQKMGNSCCFLPFLSPGLSKYNSISSASSLELVK